MLILGRGKRLPVTEFRKSLMMEPLEKSAPLIVEGVARWKDLLWEDWLDFQVEENGERSYESLVVTAVGFAG